MRPLSLRRTARFRRGGKADTPDKFAKGFFGNRAKGTVARAKNIERRLEHLVTDERIDRASPELANEAGFRCYPGQWLCRPINPRPGNRLW